MSRIFLNGADTGQTVSYVVTKTEVSSGTDLENGTTYHFQVAATNAVDTGPYSDEASAAPSDTAPEQVAGLIATGGAAQVTLSWTVPANGGDAITSYAIKVATTSDMLRTATPATVDVSDISNGANTGQTVSYVVAKTEVTSGTDLENGTTYHFQVAAVNSIGTGVYCEYIYCYECRKCDCACRPCRLDGYSYERYADRPFLGGAKRHRRSRHHSIYDPSV